MTDNGTGGRIAEGMAALGLVLSLVFVGYEIRQNTQLSKAAALQSQAELATEIILSWIADDDALRLVTRIRKGALPSDFNEHENAKIRMMYLALLRSAEIRYRQRELDILDDTLVMGGSASLLRAPYLAAGWDQIKDAVAPDFADRFEEERALN